MSSLLAKVWFDLWQDKTRTLQVTLVIALGAIGIGLVLGGLNLVTKAVADSWQVAEPPTISLAVNPPLNKAQIDRIERIDGVAEVEGLYTGRVEFRLVGSDEWETALLNGREDFQRQKMTLDGLVSGSWPGRNTVAVGLVSVGTAKVVEGDSVEMRFGDRTRVYDVVGTVDPIGPAPAFEDTFYVDGRTFTRITGRDTFDRIQMRDVVFDPAKAEATDKELQAYFEDIDVDSVGTSFPFQDRIVPPDVPPAAAIINALFFILGIIGVVVIILGIFLVYNSISAIVTQQVTQIGVMKAIGADSRQVIWSYFVLVFSYGLLAITVAIPVGGLAAFGLQNFFADFLKLEIEAFALDPTAVLIQVLVCLVAPLIASLPPLLAGMRITVREAISSYGLTGAIGLVDKLISRARNIPYTILLTIGNTFRNQRRVVIIQISLIVAGTIFMMVQGVNDATDYTFGNKLIEVHNYQVTMSPEETTRTAVLENIASQVNNVAAVESWLVLSASARPIEQAETAVTDARITIFGQPPDTTHYQPEIINGRWLRPDDGNAVVVSQRVMEEKEWQLGDQIILTDPRQRELTVQIVGVLFDPAVGTSLHIPLETVQRELRYYDLANSVWVQTEQIGEAAQVETAVALEAAYERNGVTIRPTSTFGEKNILAISERIGSGFDIIINLLVVMAVVIALVGGVGLSGVLSLSVLERRREIGVMRAIGASSWQVIRLFMGEAVLLGMMSWLIALPLSIPAAYGLTTFGLAFVLNQPLAYRFSLAGPLLWLIIISLLAIIASALPARNAARVSVRESLTYS